jgi:hypothetical protein
MRDARPGNGVVTPTVVKTTKPVYTPAAMRARIEGAVRLQCTVLADGACTDITVVKSLDADNGLDLCSRHLTFSALRA